MNQPRATQDPIPLPVQEQASLPVTADLPQLLTEMIQHKASDLFVSIGSPVVIKIEGRMVSLMRQPMTRDSCRSLVLSTMDEPRRMNFERDLEANFALATPRGRFRVSAFYQQSNVGMVIRRIETAIPSLDDLMMPEIIKTMAMSKRGILMFVGGTGAGKSTSLAAMIEHRNTHTRGHIITIEDPIEYAYTNKGCIIDQREVGVDTLSWDNALRNALRQAPDVILIGEVRDRETMEHAINFAETGHLCLCTLHANNANQAVDRVINFFPEDRKRQLLMDLSLNLLGVVAQQLVPTLDGRRRAAVETMLATPIIKEKIKLGQVDEIKQYIERGSSEGMRTFDSHLLQLYIEGVISEDEAIRHADSKTEIQQRIRLKSGRSYDGAISGLSVA